MSAGRGIFVDSNVLLYSVDPKDQWKQARAADWLTILWAEGTGRLSWQVLHEFYWNAVRKMRLDQGSAREIVEDLSHWGPVEASMGLVQQAWAWIDAAQLSYWDSLILAAAERSGADYLLSEDFQDHGRYGEILVVNPFDHSPHEVL
jgi:predicted nucleic acid-binding protein